MHGKVGLSVSPKCQMLKSPDCLFEVSFQTFRGLLKPSKPLKCAFRFRTQRQGKQSMLTVCQIWPSLLAKQRVIGLCRPTEQRYIIDVSALEQPARKKYTRR